MKRLARLFAATLKRKRTAAEDGDEETDERTHNSGDVT